MPQRAREPQRAPVPLGLSVTQRVWVPQGMAWHAGTPQAAVTATTLNGSALAASPGSTGIKKKGCKSARTKKKGGGGEVSLLACRQ